MVLNKYFASPPLRPFVRHYLYRDVSVPDDLVIRPLCARADPFLAFQLGDRYEVFEYETGEKRTLPPAFVIGPQTARLADLHLRGRVAVFFVSFQPTGFYRLFPCRMTELTDRPFAASDLMGSMATILHDRLLHAPNVDAMVHIVEEVLREKAADARPAHALDDAAAMAVQSGGRTPIGDLACAAGLSQRQFERKFVDRVGVRPKLYSRIVRFNHAVGLKERNPGLPWSKVSCEAGYFDQMHLVKDFKEFAGDAPSSFLRSLTAAHHVFPSEPQAPAPSP